MLHIYFMQHWFNLSDPGMEEALYDSRVMRDFAGIDLGEEAAPDETTILNFRHLLEAKNMGAELLRLVNVYLAENGLKVSRGTIVDASTINAPSSMKNRDQARDPDMHQTKKGNQWYFRIKLHIGVDSKVQKRTGAESQPDQVEGLDPGRACIPCAEVPVRLCQGTLPGPGEVRQSPVCGAGSGESGNCEAAIITNLTGKERPEPVNWV